MLLPIRRVPYIAAPGSLMPQRLRQKSAANLVTAPSTMTGDSRTRSFQSAELHD